MDILVTLPQGELRRELIPSDLRSRLERLGTVTWNPSDGQFSPESLSERLSGVDACITGWGTPTLDAEVLADADDIQFVGHVGGSVASIGSPALFDRNVAVCSGNAEMAPFVAEGILTYVLAALRDVSALDAEMKAGQWPSDRGRIETLFDRTVGFVGLGAVGRNLLDVLSPFDVRVLVYDPYVSDDALASYERAERADLDTVLSTSSVVSVHASLTEETVHLLDASRLERLPDGALLVNAARGPIVDEDALVEELRTGRLSAALDVYEEEPLPADAELRSLDGVLLQPHEAGAPTGHRLAEAVVGELERFARDEPLANPISRERYERMTNDALTASDGASTDDGE